MKYKLKKQLESVSQRLRKVAEVRSENNCDSRLSELLVEAANKIDELDKECGELIDIIDRLEQRGSGG